MHVQKTLVPIAIQQVFCEAPTSRYAAAPPLPPVRDVAVAIGVDRPHANAAPSLTHALPFQIPREDVHPKPQPHHHRLAPLHHASPPERFTFVNPPRREHPATQFVLNELNPMSMVVPVRNIPTSHVLSEIVVEPAAPTEKNAELGAGGEESPGHPRASQESPTTHRAKHLLRDVSVASSPQPRKATGAQRRQRPVDCRPSPEVQQLEHRFRLIDAESRATEQEHMAIRRRRKIDHRSYDHFEAMHARHAADWDAVVESTLVLKQESEAIHELYRTPIRSQVQQLPVGLTPTRALHAPVSSEFETQSSVLLLQGEINNNNKHMGVPHLHRKPLALSPIAAGNDPRDRRLSPPPTQRLANVYKSPEIVHRSTQDMIAVMEKRYQLEMEKNARHAERMLEQAERAQRLSELRSLEARHAHHEQVMVHRRRDEAKQRAQALEAMKQVDTQERIAEKEQHVKFHQWRQGVHRLSAHSGGAAAPLLAPGSFDGFAAIARRNDISRLQ